MIADESTDICERTVRKLKDEDKDYDQHPAVVAAPQWWVQKLKEAHGVGGTDLEIDNFCGCAVKVMDVPEPTLVAADGRMWSLLPAWLRARPGQAEQS